MKTLKTRMRPKVKVKGCPTGLKGTKRPKKAGLKEAATAALLQ